PIIAHKFDSSRSKTDFMGKKSLAILNVVRLSSVANLFLEINQQANNVLCGYVDISCRGSCIIKVYSMT
ncbi:MAG TPA: hypothetical protein VE843_11710, partial [Ktedonobacteraceae bacterium]|nr:hypothetical protein [Ktedonobacteraceae bacterium]